MAVIMIDGGRNGAPGSSVGRALDTRSRGPGIETRSGHIVVGSMAPKQPYLKGAAPAVTTLLPEL